MQSCGFPLLEVSGDAYQMGYRHGTEAGDLVRRTLAWIEKQSGAPRAALARRALAYLPAMQAVSPAYVEEVRGLADGARLPFEEAWLIQCRSEANSEGRMAPPGGRAQTAEGCSAFACTGTATADDRPLAGQNQDLEPECADIMILLRVAPNDGRPRALMVTFAGQLGYAGMNEWGLALFHNALYGVKTTDGLPRQPVKRLLLEQRNVTACITLLARWRLASAGNFVLCDQGGALASVEFRPDGSARCQNEPAEMALHTNHYLASAFAGHETGAVPDSAARLARLQSLTGEAWGLLSTIRVKRILADHEGDPAGICRHGATGWHSIAGYIAEPARGRLHVRRGHGCLGQWHEYEV